MAPVVPPKRTISFAAHAKGPLPVDMLDAQIQNLIDAIHSTQLALADIRRDDGQLRTPLVPQQSKVATAAIEARIVQTGAAVANSAAEFAKVARDIDLRASDAETAAFSAQQAISVVGQAGIEARDALSDAENAADSAINAATQAKNAENFAKAHSDNAIDANIEASQWAEYLAGPVVNSDEAPAYIAGHPFGHGLYYQPVEGYGGVAGLWSSKWWAVYAAQLVGPWSFYYLGSWAAPPVPGSTNPQTGVKVPNPLAPGSFYYNTSSSQLFVWDGSQWKPPFVQTLSPGFQNSYTYIATAGQTSFSGPDADGFTPVVGIQPSDVHVDGLRLVYQAEYTVNQTTSTLTLLTPATSGQVVQWDLLFSEADLGAGGVNIRKVTIAPTPDGTNKQFFLTYIDPGTGVQGVNVTGGAQLQVSLDGIVQEPGTDFVATGDILTMGAAPPVNSRFWALWYEAGAVAEAPVDAPPANVVLPAISGALAQGGLLVATAGGWTGTPTPTYAYQWKSGGSNVGASQNTYTTGVGDVGQMITVAVTATNTEGSATVSSGNFGPITLAETGDSTPDPFTFTARTDATVTTVYESNTITVTGIDTSSPVTITGGEYQKNGGAYTNVAGSAFLHDTFKVRGTSADTNLASVNVQLTIGGVSSTFVITTAAGASDTTPDAFSFGDIFSVGPSTQQVSNTITVSGVSADVPVIMTISGGEYSRNGGAYSTSSPVSVFLGNLIKLRATSSATPGANVDVTVTIGGVTDVWTIVTATASSLLAPVLELVAYSDPGALYGDNITSDNTPEFDVVCKTPPAVGDVISITRNGNPVATATLTATDIAGTTVPGLGITPLADGTYTFSARHARGVDAGSFSAGLSVTIDTVPPFLTGASATQNTINQANADLAITTSKGQGIIYWVVSDASLPPPTPKEIILGQVGPAVSGVVTYAPAGRSGNFAVTSTGARTATATGFSVSGNHKVHWTHTDTAGNNAATVSAAFTMTLAAYTANGIGGFDGSTTYMTCAIPAPLIPAGTKGLISFWTRCMGGASTDRYIFTLSDGTTNAKFWLHMLASGTLELKGRNSASVDILGIQSAAAGNPLVPPSGWVHVAFWWDLALGKGDVYLNGVVKSSTSKTLLNDFIHYPRTTAQIGSIWTVGNKWNGHFSEFYANFNDTLDLGIPANLQKFINSGGAPVLLGADGSSPTGAQPQFYLGGANTAANWGVNRGSKGSFTTPAGALTNVTGPP